MKGAYQGRHHSPCMVDRLTPSVVSMAAVGELVRSTSGRVDGTATDALPTRPPAAAGPEPLRQAAEGKQFNRGLTYAEVSPAHTGQLPGILSVRRAPPS